MITFKISLSNFQIYSSVLLTVVTMLYITSQGLTCFLTGSFYLLIPLTHFTYSLPTPHHHLRQPPICSLYLMPVCVCVCVLASMYEYNHTVFFFISLTSFSIMSSDLFANDRFPYFLWLNDISLCVYITYSLFICLLMGI